MNPHMSFPAAWTSYSLAALCLRFWVVLSPSFCLSLPISHTLCFSSSSLRPTQPCFHPHYVLWLYPLLHRPQPFLVLVVSIAGLVTLGSFPLLFFYRSYNMDVVLLSFFLFSFFFWPAAPCDMRNIIPQPCHQKSCCLALYSVLSSYLNQPTSSVDAVGYTSPSPYPPGALILFFSKLFGCCFSFLCWFLLVSSTFKCWRGLGISPWNLLFSTLSFFVIATNSMALHSICMLTIFKFISSLVLMSEIKTLIIVFRNQPLSLDGWSLDF